MVVGEERQEGVERGKRDGQSSDKVAHTAHPQTANVDQQPAQAIGLIH